MILPNRDWFLTPTELTIMKADFKAMIASRAANNVTARWKVPVITQDEGPYEDSADQWVTIQKHFRAIIKIVQPRDEEILNWGILITGDALFFFLPNTIELEDDQYRTLELEANNNIWLPVAQQQDRDFHHYISMLMGNEQISQTLAGKLKR